MFEFISQLFAQFHAHVFEGTVLPLLHQAGFGGYAEQAFDATELFLIGAIEVTLLALILGALEKWRPVEPQDEEAKRVDVLYTLLNRLGLLPLMMFFLLMPLVDGLDGWLRMHDIIPAKIEDVFPALHQWPVVSFLFYLVVLDFVAYWLHRGQHRFDWWWALHALHHSQRQMGFWADDRNHLLDDLIVDGVFALVALAIGVPPAQFITILVAGRVVESLSHANLKWHFGRIGERIMVSPRYHRMHHAIGFGHEGRARGCNFAVLFPVWDHLFGTANSMIEYPKTGIRDQLEGRAYGEGFWEQQGLGLVRLIQSLRPGKRMHP
ncbi:MAG: sterol desaturase family protein [Betaproteobacteria bacterium]|nr:sterol desaturase family protein [Betaproteobacteria bacterium]